MVADKSEGRLPECCPLFRSAQGKAEDTSGLLVVQALLSRGPGVEQGTEDSPLTPVVFSHCRPSEASGVGTPGHIRAS